MDLFHVAVAIEVAADAFLSFDQNQNALAQAAGIPLLRVKGGEITPGVLTGLRNQLAAADCDVVFDNLTRQLYATTIVASGTSCRHQIEHPTPVKPKHMAELPAEALV